MKNTSTKPARVALKRLRSNPISLKFYATLCNGLARKNRSLFCPSDQKVWYIGNCPEQAQEGDAIVLVSGVRKPLVLRQGERSYRLIGFAEGFTSIFHFAGWFGESRGGWGLPCLGTYLPRYLVT